MPKVEINYRDLVKLVGKKLSEEKLNDILMNYLKGEIDSVDGDWITIDFEDTNRPDLWSVEGISFQIKGILGIEKGFKLPRVLDSKFKVEVKNMTYRPFIAAAIVKGVKINDDIIREFMAFEEKLDMTYGRRRKRSAIGIYDLDKIKSNKITYKLVDRNFEFTPLGFNKKMKISEILKVHPKGVEYSNLVGDKVPMLIGGNVLSMPPITNSEETKITKNTKNLFIEATGTNEETVNFVVSLISYLLWLRGGKVYRVKVNFDKLREKSGLEISNKEIKSILEKMRFKVRSNLIESPPTRVDIMDDVDIVEDLLIGFGYNNIQPIEIEFFTRGKRRDEKIREIREKLIGAGFQEIMTYTLIDEESLKKVGVKGIRILNPCNMNYTHIRSTIVPSILKFLAKNKTVEYPHKVFEIGHTVDNGEDKIKLCVAVSDSKATFTDIKKIYNILSNDKIERFDSWIFIPGRAARSKRCVFGEVHPKILKEFDVEMPTVILEMEL